MIYAIPDNTLSESNPEIPLSEAPRKVSTAYIRNICSPVLFKDELLAPIPVSHPELIICHDELSTNCHDILMKMLVINPVSPILFKAFVKSGIKISYEN